MIQEILQGLDVDHEVWFVERVFRDLRFDKSVQLVNFTAAVSSGEVQVKMELISQSESDGKDKLIEKKKVADLKKKPR